MKNISKLTLASVIITTVLFVVWMIVFHISSLISAFIFIEIGKFTGPILGLILATSVLVLFLIFPSIPLMHFAKGKSKKEVLGSIKRHRKRVIGIILIGLSLSFLVTVLLSAPFMLQIKDYDRKIDAFVVSNSNKSLTDFAGNLTVFLNENMNSSYKRSESLFEIDAQLTQTALDPLIMHTWNVTNVDVILYQGWGSCGQAAILLAQVMNNSGYESRIAHFKGVDHEWAEVRNETNWLIVDPWYIGNLIDIQFLRDAKPAFQQASGVEVNYFDSAGWVDASKDHGY